MQAMESANGPQTPYESYCHRCRVTTPVGTRRCVHCGGPIGRPGVVGEQAAPPELHAEEDAPPQLGMLRRLGGISLWILIAVGAALSRMCEGG